jgi:hypothetical protein
MFNFILLGFKNSYYNIFKGTEGLSINIKARFNYGKNRSGLVGFKEHKIFLHFKKSVA